MHVILAAALSCCVCVQYPLSNSFAAHGQNVFEDNSYRLPPMTYGPLYFTYCMG